MSFLEQTDTGDAQDADVEQALRVYYEHEFGRFGDAPATDTLLARLAPTLEAAPQGETLPALLKHVRRWRWFGASAPRVRRVQRIALVPALVAVALLTGAAAVFVAPLVERVFTIDSGTLVVHEQHLGRDVNLSRTFDSQTMTVEWVYADANQIVILESVQAATGQTLNCYPGGSVQPVVLTDNAGGEYPIIEGAGAFPVPGKDAGPGECLLLFDAGALTGASPTTLRLRLELRQFCSDIPIFPEVPSLPGDGGGGATGATTISPCGHEVPANSPPGFAFDLSVPFYGGTVVTVNQTVHAGGTSVTLDRMVLSPSETRLYVHGFTRANGFDPDNPPAESSITIDGRAPVLPKGTAFVQSARQATTDGEIAYDLSEPLADAHGQWAVSLHTDHAPGAEGQPATWTFHFRY